MFEEPETTEEQLQAALDMSNGQALRKLTELVVANERVLVFVTVDRSDLQSLNDWLGKDDSTDAALYRPLHERLADITETEAELALADRLFGKEEV